MTEAGHASDDVEIVEVLDGVRLEQVRSLLHLYEQALRDHAGSDSALDAQGFDAELAGLPGEYAPPRGTLLLVLVNGAPAGCVAIRPIDDEVAELKRLFVAEEFRGQSLGRRLLQDAMDRSVQRGVQRLRLDTLPFMRSAIKLYRSFEFTEIPPYAIPAMPGTRFFERRLEERTYS